MPSVLAMPALALMLGCAQVREHKSSPDPSDAAAMKKAMRRKDEIVFLSSPELDARKPVLLLLHGATDNPAEMNGIVRAFREKYNVLLYAYNYHQPIKKVGADFVKELKLLREQMKKRDAENLTVVTYSYSASVFRQAVLQADQPALFANVSLIQLVPTAAGSYLARSLKNPIGAWFTGLASKPSAVENPYGHIAAELWGQSGSGKFYEMIPERHVYSILIEDDLHSVARIQDPEIQRRYHNGIGDNVVVIPKSTGVSHEYFPNDPVALEYLRKVLDAIPATAASDRVRLATGGQGEKSINEGTRK